MALRWSSVAFLVALSVLLPSCKTRNKVQPVSVRIYHDLSSPYGPALDHRILDFEATNPRLPNGAAVQVGTLASGGLQAALNHTDDPGVDIVILDSPAQALDYPALQPQMSQAVNVCGALEACPTEVPAVLPANLPGERAEAANKFVQFLAAQKMPAPAPQPATPESAPAQAPADTPAKH